MKTIVYNGNVILPDTILCNSSVVIENGIITGVIEQPDPQLDNAVYIDAEHNYIAPGFIDIHLHGGGGGDVMSCSAEELKQIAYLHLMHGMTSMVPTTLTAPEDQIIQAIETISKVKESKYRGAQILGIHLEGPYFSMKFRGAQNPSFLRKPLPGHYQKFIESSPYIIRVSAAPELEGSMQMAQYLSARGILVSVAHSDADFRIMKEAARNGFSHITHMFNGMSGLKSPDFYMRAGVIESALLMDEFNVEVIADGRHISPEMLQLLYKCKGPDKMSLTTDAVRAAGTCLDSFQLGGLEVIVEDGVAMLKNKSSFAGSMATADNLVRTAYKIAGFSLVDSVKMASLTPARMVGMNNKLGSIESGKAADIVIFDENINVIKVIQRGETVVCK